MISRTLLPELNVSKWFVPHLIAVFIGLLNISAVLTVPNSIFPRPIAHFSKIPNAISNGNSIITANTLKKSCTVAAAKARLNSLLLLIWPIDTRILVIVVPMFAPMIIGMAPDNVNAPALTIPTISEVVVDEL